MSDYGRIILSDPVNVAHPLNRGLAAWWFALPQWSGGNTWFDLCRRNNGTLTNGPAWRPASRPGGFGELSFDGTNDLVQVADAAAIDLTDNFTLCAWIKKAVSASDMSLFTKGLNGYEFDISGGNSLRLNKDNVTVMLSAAWADNGAWHFVAATKAGSAVSLAIDSSVTTGSTVHSLSSTGRALVLGADDATGVVKPFSGPMDDFRIYNRALPAAEVAALYDLGRRGYQGVLRRVGRAWSVPSAAGATISPRILNLTGTDNTTAALTGVRCTGHA